MAKIIGFIPAIATAAQADKKEQQRKASAKRATGHIHLVRGNDLPNPAFNILGTITGRFPS